MEIKFNGDFTVKKTPQEVYDFLVDPNRFCPLLPDYQSMEILDAKNFLVKLSVGISHIRGTAAVKMSLVEAERATRAVYEGRATCPAGLPACALDLICKRRRAERPRWFGSGNRMWLVELLRWRAGCWGRRQKRTWRNCLE